MFSCEFCEISKNTSGRLLPVDVGLEGDLVILM